MFKSIKMNKYIWFAFLLLLTFFLAACGQSISIISTEIDAGVTLATSSSTPSPLPALTSTMPPTTTLFPTETLFPTTAIPTFTLTPYPSATVVFSGYLGCANSEYVKDVTIPDGTILAPGEAFKKTWRLKNTGTCKWTEDYSITFISGISMDGETTTLDKNVLPDKAANVTVELTAPDVEGTFSGYWLLANEDGIGFGQLIYVQIIVSDED